jgi:hypothetical protein
MITILNKLLLASCILFTSTGIANAQDDAITVLPNGNVGIGIQDPKATLEVNGDMKLGLGKKIWWDYENRSIDVFELAGFKTIRFRNSMTTEERNSKGGFDFTTAGGISVLRIVDKKVGIGKSEPGVALDVNGEIKASGDIKTDRRVKDSTGFVVPVGGIIMYTGDLKNFDGAGVGIKNTPVEGWALCNGNNNRPDLRDKFVVGAGREYSVGATGGEKTHRLTLDEMPKHMHGVGFGGGGRGNFGAGNDNGNQQAKTMFSQPTADAGGDQPHENRPPYYAVAYIMKL